VLLEMRPQQAQIACNDVLLRPLDLLAAENCQGTLLAALAEWELPTEPQTWGMAYVDLHSVAKTPAAVQPLAADLGRRLRRSLGEKLQPALGWDSGKFTARAAALRVQPGRMRLVDKADELRFLGPLPITLLPLPRAHLQQLHWLGISTLGQFAQLPAASVWQRFGAAGKQAQRWAQGRDDRPVRAAVANPVPPVAVTLDPPSGMLQPVVEAVMASLRPLLLDRTAALEGVRHIRLAVDFVVGEPQTADLVFVEPASQASRVQAALVQQLCRLRWPGAVQKVQWTLLECGELSAPQLRLLPEPPGRLRSLHDLAGQLSSRYGPTLFRAAVPAAAHPVPERRGALQPLASPPASAPGQLPAGALAHVTSLA
jgi:hypothetical protein